MIKNIKLFFVKGEQKWSIAKEIKLWDAPTTN